MFNTILYPTQNIIISIIIISDTVINNIATLRWKKYDDCV